MSKEIKSNTFNNGLMMDLHPINTPNTVLTDNLNGTIITYDGNEHVLQNDMGNYRLKDCKLKSNYIPIGLKEYAGILYIVSYNPLDEHVEIGTYPSPEIKTPSTYSGVEKQLSTFESLSGKYNYSSLTKPQSVIWYDEKLKIHPGDYYKISTDVFDNFRIIKNAWFIMTDDKTLQEIEVQQNTNDYVPVNWEYPGYLVFQQKIVTPTEFNAFVSQLNLPKYIETEDSNLPDIVDGKLGFEITLSKIDYNRLVKNNMSLKDVVSIDVTVTKTDQSGHEELMDVKWDQDNKKFTVYDFGESEINISGLLDLSSPISGLKKTDTLIFNITPIFKDDNFEVAFDQYKVTETINLNKIGSIADLKIGSETYKFWRQNKTCYVVFNIDSPTIIVGDVNLYLRLVDLDNNPIYLNDTLTDKDGWFSYDDEVLSGENMIALRLTKEQCEQIYILEFCFGDERGPDVEMFNIPRFKKLLITSIVFNDFVSSKAIFDKEISFSEWYKLHDKYAKFNPDDLHININLDDHEFTTTTEKEIIRVSNEKYWNTTLNDAQNFTYSLAVRDGDEIPKYDYTFGYVQENIPVTGDIITLNENMLNYGLWKIPENEIFIKIGDTVINCNPDETFSDDNLSCVLAKNSVIDTVACETASIPSVDKVFINRGLTLEKTEISENGEEIVTILEDQQLVGHEYGAGAANSSADRRQYNWAAENIVTSIVTFASKLSVFLSTIETINKFTMLGIATGAGLAVLTWVGAWIASVPILGPISIGIALIAVLVVGAMLIATGLSTLFGTERHLSWASSLYSTKIDTIEELEEQFDETENGTYEPNEKFKNNLSLTLIKREQGTQWHKQNDLHTELKNITHSLLRQNTALTTTYNNKTTSISVKNKTLYSCFPVLFQTYATEDNGLSSNDGICLNTSGTGGRTYLGQCSDEFTTHYSVWIAFQSPSNENHLVYTPCTFDGMMDNMFKLGSISNYVDHNTGAPTSSDGVVSENNPQTIVDVSKMVASAIVWCRDLFVVSEEGEMVSANFMEPVFEDIPYDASMVFEYEFALDYTKSKYMGRTLTDNRRLSLYNLQDKVENLSLMSGASVTLENRYISNKLQIKTLKPISDNVLNTLTDKINEKFSRFKNFGMYCDHQIAYIKLDPVITENVVRNGKMKGVYNASDSYDASGGLLYKLNQLSNLDEALTFPLSDGVVKYHLCSRNKGKLGNTNSQMWITLGYDSKLKLDRTNTYFDLQSQ